MYFSTNRHHISNFWVMVWTKWPSLCTECWSLLSRMLFFVSKYNIRQAAMWWHGYTPSNSAMLSWWRHQIETFYALMPICAGNSPVSGEFPAQRPVTRSFDVFFDLRLNKRLSKQSWGWWFETLPRPLWPHNNVCRLLCSPAWRKAKTFSYDGSSHETHVLVWRGARWSWVLFY